MLQKANYDFHLTVSAVKFDGYQLTAPQTLPYTNSEVEYLFGFKSQTAEPIPSPAS